MDHDKIIYFQEFKAYPSHFEYEKKSLLANIFCLCVIVFFGFYFLYKIGPPKNKPLREKKS